MAIGRLMVIRRYLPALGSCLVCSGVTFWAWDAVRGDVRTEAAAPTVLAMGCGMGLLFSGLVLWLSVAREQARRIADGATRDLRAAEARFRDIFNNCTDGIYRCGADGRLTVANPAMATMLGYATPEALLASPAQPRLPVAAAGGCILPQEVSVRRVGGGDEVCLSVRAHAVRDAATGQLVTEGIATDVTGIRRAQAEATRRAQVEAERNRLRDSVSSMEQVLGVVGHELRTPLAAIRAMAEVMLDPATAASADRGAFTQSILSQTAHLVTVIGNILDVARYNGGHGAWRFEEFSLSDICAEAAGTVRPIVAPGVEMGVSIPPDVRMRGDVTAVRRLLINLLSNACKFTEAGRIELSCTYDPGSVDSDGYVVLRVRDTGRGISGDVQRLLGTPFALSSGAVGARHVEGSGLGLSLCATIAAAHGGELSIDSKPGRGTTITAHLRTDLREPAMHAAAAHIKLTRTAA